MRYGTIVKYLSDKKFGFIRPESGPDIFFHISALDCDDEAQPEIEVGQPVKYELAPRERLTADGSERPTARDMRDQPKAKLVTLIDKVPGGKLAEFDVNQAPTRHRRARQKKPTWRR